MENKFPDRKSPRFKDYDYDYNSPGYYFITICVKNMVHVFGEIKNGKMILNKYGFIAERCLLDLPNHYNRCKIDHYVIMPNHVHVIIIINDCNRREGSATLPPNEQHGITEVLRGFKTFSSKEINNLLSPGKKFSWQKSFYDRIIRNEKELYNIRKYIEQNPLKWEFEKNVPGNLFI